MDKKKLRVLHEQQQAVRRIRPGDERPKKGPQISPEEEWALYRRELHHACEAKEKEVSAIEKKLMEEQMRRNKVQEDCAPEQEEIDSLTHAVSVLDQEAIDAQQRCALLRGQIADRENTISEDERRIKELEQALTDVQEETIKLTDQTQTLEHNRSMQRARLQREVQAGNAEVQLLQDQVARNKKLALSIEERTAAARDFSYSTKVANMHRTMRLIDHVDHAKGSLLDVSVEKRDFTAALCTEREKWRSLGSPASRRLERKVLDDGPWLGTRLQHTAHKDVELIRGFPVD